MQLSLRRIVLSALLAAVVGCSAIGGANAPVVDNKKSTGSDSAGRQVKNAVTLRINQYVDQRPIGKPRILGKIEQRVYGLYGSELVLDQDVAVIATSAFKKRFDSEGFRVLEGGDANNALFEVSGVIKELVLNVKNRDEINISIETTLKDVTTGKVVWSGLVTEKNDRFAGVSGNSKEDLDAYLNKGLLTVSGKTVEAISASLMAARPELFNLTPGTKVIMGVDVYVAPPSALPTPATLPAMPSASAEQANVSLGVLSVNTNPSRARVYLDGIYFGLSPLRSEIESGVHEVVVQLKGYKTVTEKVSVRKGDKTEMELSLER